MLEALSPNLLELLHGQDSVDSAHSRGIYQEMHLIIAAGGRELLLTSKWCRVGVSLISFQCTGQTATQQNDAVSNVSKGQG